MTEPERERYGPAYRRRRTRRVPPLVSQLEPEGVELWPEPAEGAEAAQVGPDGAGPVVADAPNGPPEALCGVLSDETPSGGIRTPGNNQGERRRPHSARPAMPPGGWPMVAVDAEPTDHEPTDHEPPEPEAPEPAEPEPVPVGARSWRSADDPELAALLAWQPPELEPSGAPEPFGYVALPAVVAGMERPAAHLSYMAELSRAARMSAHVVADMGGPHAERLADDVAALYRIASWASAVVGLAEPS